MWYQIANDGTQVVLHVVVKPNAKQTAVLAVTEDALQISLHAQPHAGEANQSLIAYLSKCLRIPKRDILLKRGEKSRHKMLILPLTDTVETWLLDQENSL